MDDENSNASLHLSLLVTHVHHILVSGMHILLERRLTVRQCRHSFLNVRHLEIVLWWAVSHPLRFSDEPEHSQLSVGFVVFKRSVFNR